MVDTFDRNFQFHVAHVSIAKKADVLLIAPASANVIGKLANGIADDMLTTTAMACTCKTIIAPAMNTNMYHNPILQDNLKKLEGYGYEIIAPEKGLLACRDIGDGKMPSEDVLVGHIVREIAYEKDLAGMKVIVTAGPTQESIDPVRYITNHSTGKMGYELAKAADLGLNYYDEDHGISLSASARNLGGQVQTYADTHEDLPLDVAVGISKRLSAAPLRFSATLSRLNSWDVSLLKHLTIGADVFLGDHVYVAAGYHFRRPSEMRLSDGDGESSHGAGLSCGAGLQLERFKFHVAYARYHVSASSLLLGASYSF